MRKRQRAPLHGEDRVIAWVEIMTFGLVFVALFVIDNVATLPAIVLNFDSARSGSQRDGAGS